MLIQEQKLETLNSLVNLSSEFYVQAKVEDTSKIFVHIGLGFHPELTLTEALAFVDEKEKIMNESVHSILMRLNMSNKKFQARRQNLTQRQPDPASNSNGSFRSPLQALIPRLC